MFTAALFTVAKNWEQQRCPSNGEYTNWYIHTMGYSCKNMDVHFAKRKKSDSRGYILYSLFMRQSEKGRTTGRKNRTLITRVWWRECN